MKLGIVMACVFMSGCASVQAQQPSLGTLLGADLDAAISIAQANGDSVAAGCYTALKNNLPKASQQPIAPAGVVSGFELARLGINKLNVGVPSEVHIACSPLVVDAATVGVGLVKLFKP